MIVASDGKERIRGLPWWVMVSWMLSEEAVGKGDSEVMIVRV